MQLSSVGTPQRGVGKFCTWPNHGINHRERVQNKSQANKECDTRICFTEVRFLQTYSPLRWSLPTFRDRGVPKPTSECRRVPQPRWVDARPSAKGGSEVAGDGLERGGNPAAFVFVPRPGRVRLQ